MGIVVRLKRITRPGPYLTLAGLFCSSSGCGASYQALYEGEVRFEHCYRLDEEPSIPLTQRRECWREWTQFYTFGQTRDRLEYALRRQRELTTQIENPHAQPDEISDIKTLSSNPMATPSPTNPFAPPPHLQNENSPSTPPADPIPWLESLASNPQPTVQSCLMQCMSRWKTCTDTCSHTNDECRKDCDSAFKACSQRCLE